MDLNVSKSRVGLELRHLHIFILHRFVINPFNLITFLLLL
jgi:hypothetical protein